MNMPGYFCYGLKLTVTSGIVRPALEGIHFDRMSRAAAIVSVVNKPECVVV
jgi:hypothetical protein